MSDFITDTKALASLNGPDLSNLQGVEKNIAKPQYFKYFGMHRHEGVVYLTYYYNIPNVKGDGEYKFDITVHGNDYQVVLKRVDNQDMSIQEFNACSAIRAQFPKAQTTFVSGNLIDLGIYSQADTVKNMQSVLLP